jgi:hypothetical protein
MITDQQKKVLERAMYDAAILAGAHKNAVRDAAMLFESFFGEEVPEESYSLTGGNSKNEVGSLFNNYVNWEENYAGKSSKALVNKICKLMDKIE